MRLFRPVVIAGLLAAPARFGHPALAQSIDSAAVLASAHPDIDAANRAWVPGLRQRNAALLASAYADSGLFIAPNGAVIRGRAAIARMYEARFPGLRTIRQGAVMQDGLVVVSADCVYEWGHAWLEQEGSTPGGPPVRDEGPYLTVWQRQSDGHWRIVRNLVI